MNIPPGVQSGTQMRLSGEGEAGAQGGPRGDLYIFFDVLEHDIFERDETHLYCRTPVTMTTAALGGEIEIPTIDGGRARVNIPEGAQTGRKLRLKGKGMPSLRGQGKGDLYICLLYTSPSPRDKRQSRMPSSA